MKNLIDPWTLARAQDVLSGSKTFVGEMSMSDEIPRGRRQFEQALAALKREHSADKSNPGSYGCVDCERCYHCMFTTGSTDCFYCTYCTDCVSCTHCTHCRECEECHNSSYCTRSKNCTNSSYLILCQECEECVFCFGCVGLVKKEFHILNQRFSRDQYFRIVAELKASFGIE